MSRRARVAGLIGAAVALGSCGGGGGGTVQARASTTTTTTVPATRGGGGSVNIGIICSTPSDAAHALVDAWMAGDRAAATRCGSPVAVATLFAQPGTGVTWTFQRCSGTVCSFSSPHGTARLTVGGSDAAGWTVDQVQLG